MPTTQGDASREQMMFSHRDERLCSTGLVVKGDSFFLCWFLLQLVKRMVSFSTFCGRISCGTLCFEGFFLLDPSRWYPGSCSSIQTFYIKMLPGLYQLNRLGCPHPDRAWESFPTTEESLVLLLFHAPITTNQPKCVEIINLIGTKHLRALGFEERVQRD